MEKLPKYLIFYKLHSITYHQRLCRYCGIIPRVPRFPSELDLGGECPGLAAGSELEGRAASCSPRAASERRWGTAGAGLRRPRGAAGRARWGHTHRPGHPAPSRQPCHAAICPRGSERGKERLAAVRSRNKYTGGMPGHGSGQRGARSMAPLAAAGDGTGSRWERGGSAAATAPSGSAVTASQVSSWEKRAISPPAAQK